MRFPTSSGKIQLFIFGFIVILFEVIFTRLASAYFQYHYAFLILSLAMLSFCVSGIVYQNATEKRRMQIFDNFMVILPASFLLLLFLLVFSITTNMMGSTFGFVVITTLGFGILFVCGFLVVSLLGTEKNPGLSYGINLLGGGMGGLAAVLILSFGDPYAGLAVCSIVSVLGMRKVFERKKLLFSAVLFLALSLPFLTIAVKNPNMVWEEWNAFSRVTVDDLPGGVVWGGRDIPEDELPASFQLVIDSCAVTTIILEPEKSEVLAKDITHAGYYFLENGSSVAIIGSGGGRDIIAAKEFNPSKIKAIEINPLVIEAVNSFSPQTYTGVDIIIADGRESITVSQDKFDLVQLSLVDTWAAVSSGSHALTENYLYTKEAFGTYLNSLGEKGMISITYWNGYVEKFLSLAFVALKEAGVEEPSEHILVFKQNSVSTILIKKNPWTKQEIVLAENLAEKNNYLLVPLEEKYDGVINTDDSPFFFFNEHGLRFLVALFVTISILLITTKNRVTLAIRESSRSTLLFFALIGFGFMSIESVFIQRFLLAIHNPTITVALVFTSFLVFSGIGSILSKRIGFRYSFALVPLLLLFAFGWGEMIPLFYRMDLTAKIAISICMIAPFAILMGTFFPKGLAYLKANKLDEIGNAWTINGMAAVFAPILTILIAVYSGFTIALLTAAAAYLVSWMIGIKELK